ncbi:endoglucanase [Halobacteriales archaeon QS_8_65_32]|jgi:hypothetical protein|nr:MAG: endoglucanase [Halobacteriales archaeon QS_8_65_32]
MGLVCAAGLAGCSSRSDSASSSGSASESTDGSTRATGAADSDLAAASDTAPTSEDSDRERETDGTDETDSTDAADAAEDTTAAPEPEPRSGATLSGLAIDAKPDSIAKLGPYGRWVGQQPATVETFVNGLESPDQVRRFVEKLLTPIWERGSVPIVTWMPAYTEPPEDSDPLVDRRIHEGEYDRIIETWAEELAAWTVGSDGDRAPERRLYFRPAHEMNGNWFPWSATDETSAEDYIGMWRYVRRIFADTAMDETNIQWMWAPNADEVGDVDAEAYYPGDEYVDWIGLDGFNFGDVESWSDWRSPEELFGGMLDRVQAIADKPIALTEFASTSYYEGEYRPEKKAEWIADAYAMIEREDIAMACWFDIDKDGTDESDWAVFGGDRGTATYTDLRTASRYPVYEEYERTIDTSWVLPARPEYPRVLSDEEFRGEF